MFVRTEKVWGTCYPRGNFSCCTAEELSGGDTSKFLMRKAKRSPEVSSKPFAPAVEWHTPPPPSQLSLPAGIVHVWRAELGLKAAQMGHLEQNLRLRNRRGLRVLALLGTAGASSPQRGLQREILALYMNTSARRLSIKGGADTVKNLQILCKI